MIQIYTGDGKGKTTASLGLAIRAAGHGYKVRIIQFLKGNTFTGELVSMARMGIEVYQFGRTCPHAAVIKSGLMACQKCRQCWIGLQEITELDRNKIDLAWQLARDSVGQGYDVLILDEIINAVNRGLVPLADLIKWLQSVPQQIEVVLTGRNTPQELIESADLVSEIRKIKHPYEKGVSARRGIEY